MIGERVSQTNVTCFSSFALRTVEGVDERLHIFEVERADGFPLLVPQDNVTVQVSRLRHRLRKKRAALFGPNLNEARSTPSHARPFRCEANFAGRAVLKSVGGDWSDAPIPTPA